MNPSDLLGGQPVQEMAPSVRGIRKAPGAHSIVAARHARVECIFRNIDTQYPVNHCPILPPRVFSESSASNNLVRRIYAHACPKIPSNLNSGAWKTGPNLPHRLIRQRDERGSPFSSLLGKMCHIRQAICNVQGTIWGVSKLGGRNITKYLQPRKSTLREVVIRGTDAGSRPIVSWGRPTTSWKKQMLWGRRRDSAVGSSLRSTPIDGAPYAEALRRQQSMPP